MAEKQENSIFAEKLKGLKLDYDDYGKLPIKLDVLAIEVPEGKPKESLVAQYNRLLYIRQHLQSIDQYIKSKTKDPINLWDSINKIGLSTKVLSELKGHNNDTGGISAYFYNLQTLYDNEEEMYDKMEAACKLPIEVEQTLTGLSAERKEKRINRSKIRKLIVKDLKKDGKGYLYIEVEEPPVKEEGVENNKAVDGENKTVDISDETEKIKKSTKKIGIYVAGFMIFITAVIVTININKKENE